MEDKKMEFIVKALEVYMKYGIKSVTMDEMARQVGVSKKTIYQYVSDKNDLVEQCIKCAQMIDIEMIKMIASENDNAIDEVLAISKHVSEELKKIHPSIFFDLTKYHPSAMNMIKCHKDDFIRDCVKDNLIKGIEQGLYRENLNVKIISKVYLFTMDHVLAGELFDSSKVTPEEVYSGVFKYHIHGIASEKGIAYFNNKINNKQIKS
jgi:AcrR family transcriptional regulator